MPTDTYVYVVLLWAIDWLKPDNTLFGLLGAPAGAALTFDLPPGKAIGLDRPFKNAYARAGFESRCRGGFEIRLLAAAQHRAFDIDDLRTCANLEHRRH